MELLYVKEHLTCYNYDGGGRPAVEMLKLSAGEQMGFKTIEPEIMILLKGNVNVSFEKMQNGKMADEELILFPPCSRVTVIPEKDSEMIIFRLRTDTQLCDRYSIEKLYGEMDGEKERFSKTFNKLKANERINNFISHFTTCMTEGLKCIYFFEIKIKELFFILRAYYPKEKLAAFFAPLLCADSKFLYFVLDNYAKVRSVKEFAQVAGYSTSGFDKQFRKVFGMSAYQWMKQKRLKEIYHDINCSRKSFREICDDQGFSSLSQFNDYCKKNFELPPGKLRRKASCQI